MHYDLQILMTVVRNNKYSGLLISLVDITHGSKDLFIECGKVNCEWECIYIQCAIAIVRASICFDYSKPAPFPLDATLSY